MRPPSPSAPLCPHTRLPRVGVGAELHRLCLLTNARRRITLHTAVSLEMPAGRPAGWSVRGTCINSQVGPGLGCRVVVPFGRGNRRAEGVVLAMEQGIQEGK